ncbi:P2X purinoceptor 7 isoform X2 [Rhinatrema bivittatum]|uniref:P2X purinoceptor 7 isoform X2 n=1 Tax=Rhinatrema bivittatum TaxID=194408 RepID=UPI0011278A88|nr:P2X purinoceptor 7 isoform X2 [Rhinatrema bivittatum]
MSGRMLICIILFKEKRYQDNDSVISSVHTKVKGVAQTDSRIWDTAEYTLPLQGLSAFFVITNVITTENQVQGVCPEYPTPRTMCSSDKVCKKDYAVPQGNGIQTGKCIQYNTTIRTCEISAWCPVESERSPPEPAILNSAANFTVLIKNNIHFPAFNYTTRNILPEFNVSCMFNKTTDPQCPIFRLGDIVEEVGESFSEMAVQGGIMGIQINWDCNLDTWMYHCRPKYSFRRLDDKKANEAIYPFYNFRFAKYYKLPSGKEGRTLIKAYGIRFDILVFGTAGKFDFFELVIYIGSSLSYFGLATLLIDCLISRTCCCCCSKICPAKDFYSQMKSEPVTGPFCDKLCFSFVDEDYITFEDGKLGGRLQIAECKKLPKHSRSLPGDLINLQLLHPALAPPSQPCDSHTMQPTTSTEMRPLQQVADGPDWCHCGKCRHMYAAQEELCCRRMQPGPCITDASLFERLVLSRTTLEFILSYSDPFFDADTESSNDKFRRCAYSQYIRWQFDSNIWTQYCAIPSCCKWKIREKYPKAKGKYHAFIPKPVC